MDEVPIAGVEESRGAFKTFLAIYDAPAYVRRARAVEGALAELLHRCRQKRDEWLPMVRLRLAMLKALAGEWDALRPLLDDDSLGQLRRLHDELTPSLRSPVLPTTSLRRLRRALAELCGSIELFNRRWREYLPTVELDEVNALRDGYNRWYVLEKECAVRSPRLAREGFVRLEPLTSASLLELLPPLGVPREKQTRS